MYYHHSPTTQQIKALKRAKALEMKLQLDAMAATTKRYQPLIDKLQKLRDQELLIENEMSTGRLNKYQLDRAHAVIAANRNKAAKLVAKVLPDFNIETK